MIYRTLGRTGIRLSAIAFGCGPVAGLMTGRDRDTQLAAVARAIEAGINWFDTAAGYGQGLSEMNLGRAIAELNARGTHLATKVRIPAEGMDDIEGYVRQSVEESLGRLRVDRVTLLQLHNGITSARAAEPASITPGDVLGPVANAMNRLREEGLVSFIGLTGTGEAGAMREVVRSDVFDTLQVPFNILNPSAALPGPIAVGEVDYGQIIGDCQSIRMGVFAIRVFAGGALLDRPPSEHTLTTPYFPLALYESDRERARQLSQEGNPRIAGELALRFVLAHEGVSSAILGFSDSTHIDEAIRFLRPATA